MIWNDSLLLNRGAELVSPFDPALVNPASIDLRLGNAYRRWSSSFDGQWGHQITAPAGFGIVMAPGEFLLCCSLETVTIPPDACAALFSKSSTGRRGIEHLHAGWVDPGFRGQLTWELKNVTPSPVVLTVGAPLMQLVLYGLTAPAERDYSQTGRYQGQSGATPAR